MENEQTKQKNKHMKSNNRNNILLNVLLIVMIFTFLYSGYNILIWVKSDRETKALEEGLFNEVIEEIKKEDENEEKSIQVDFIKLKEINKDIIAWIKIENTHINYPILQGDTDEYYLRRDIYKNYSISGSIFVDSNINYDFTDENTVIYGHNMKTGRMFADLHKIHSGELGTDIIIEIYTEGKMLKYKVISAYIDEPKLSIIQRAFAQGQKENYIKNAITKSNLRFANEVDTSKKILTLITCDKTRKNRVIVNAIEI